MGSPSAIKPDTDAVAHAPVSAAAASPSPSAESTPAPPPVRARLRRSAGERPPAKAPIRGVHLLRVLIALLVSAMCLLTVGGAVLVLLLWQQDRAASVLTSQLERTWDLFDSLRAIERIVAFAAIPVGMAWIGLVTLNVRRATGQRHNPIIAACSLPVGVLGAWIIGRELVEPASDFIGRGSGFVLQAVFLAIPLLALLRVAHAAEARHRPMRAAYVVAVASLGALQFVGGLSTIDRTTPAEDWSRVGAYLVIMALFQILGALTVTEGARAIEDGATSRYELRHRFGESLLSQLN